MSCPDVSCSPRRMVFGESVMISCVFWGIEFYKHQIQRCVSLRVCLTFVLPTLCYVIRSLHRRCFRKLHLKVPTTFFSDYKYHAFQRPVACFAAQHNQVSMSSHSQLSRGRVAMLAFQTRSFTLRNRAPTHEQDKKKQFVGGV